MNAPAKTAKSATASGTTYNGFTTEERAAMKERAQELKAAARRGSRKAPPDETGAVLEKIAEMQQADRVLAERLHALITGISPDISPRLWYGMPAYASGGNTICFFQCAQKFRTRYATLGFSDKAHLDDGAMWPTTYALTELTEADEARIGELVRQALS